MRFLKLTLAYDGTAYAGWQIQLKDRTLQGVIEAALKKITGEDIRLIASGRTDSGVHAFGQVASLCTESTLTCNVLRRAINANTPFDITVLSVEEAPNGFHAIRHAIKKRYRYVIQDGRLGNPFLQRYAWHVPHHLDTEAMQQGANHLLGEHDFTSYAAKHFQAKTSVRHIYELTVGRVAGDLLEQIHIEVEANGFLYNMVRNIVGVLVEVGRGVRTTNWPQEVLQAKNRQAAGMTAPPQGLTLLKVWYELNTEH